MSDRPDYTLPVSIEGYTIVSLPIDIKSQSIGNIGIDIKAQTLGNININIAASAATLNVNLSASAITLNVNITNTTITVTGTVAISGSVTVTGTVAVSGSVTVTGAVTVSGTVAISGSVTITGAVTITSGTITFTNTTIAVTGSVTVSGTVAVSGTVTVSGSVTVSGTVAISGSVTVTGAVTVTGSVTISGAVTITSGTVNIQTSGGTNIVLDKLTQGAYTERRSTISNDSEATNVATLIGNYRGKFFPRGMRGFIVNLSIELSQSNVNPQVFTAILAPYIGAGEIARCTFTSGGAFALSYQTFTALNRMWNYDSMYIYLLSNPAAMEVGYDATAPYDEYVSVDSGVTWLTGEHRYHFRVIMQGETIGDVPVSGIVNNIEIPNAISTQQYVGLVVQATSELLATKQEGSGKSICAIWMAPAAAEAGYLYPRLYVDGVSILPYDREMTFWYGAFAGNPNGFSVNQNNFGGANMYYWLVMTLRVPFKRSIQVGFYNTHNDEASTGYVSLVYEKVS